MEIFMTYILPPLVVMGIAGLLAFGLAFLGEKMTVIRDPKIDDVVRHLSGANCGGCGYAGCDEFAKALVEGKAELNMCSVTSSMEKDNIRKILNTDGGEAVETVAVVHCLGGNRAKDKGSYHGIGDCQSAELIAGGGKLCSYGCLGLGSCNDSCKFEAICVNKDIGVAEVTPSKCTSCGACVSACPKKIISRIPKNAVVYIGCSNTHKGREVADICEFGCISCGKCVKNCPTEAITLANNLAVIDYSKCIGCGKCAEVCPRHCIVKR